MTDRRDQVLLYRDLTSRLDGIEGSEALIAFMAGVLQSLLRRRGDDEFRRAVQDSFTTGLAGLSPDEQRHLAREVIALVIAKRPEIALAWQQLHPEDAPHRRRAVDQASADDLPDLDLAPFDLPADDLARDADAAAPGPAAYAHARAEAAVAAHVGGVLERRLAIFTAPEPRFPSVAYVHEQPFFLFSPAFPRVVRRFFAEVAVPLCRDGLERHLYRHLDEATLAGPARLDLFLSEKRPELWRILTERLGKLGGHHNAAATKLVRAGAPGGGPEFQSVDVPVSRPRVIRVLGVAFRLGSRTRMERMQVRLRPSTELEAEERLALDLVGRLRDMAGQEGLDLPAACDLHFLRQLLEFDAKHFAQATREFAALVEHKATSRDYLRDRLKAIDQTYANTLADALLILLFNSGGHLRFADLHEIWMGAAQDDGARAALRPFLKGELGRRPRDLAFQLREVLRRRYDEDTLGAALDALFEVWSVLGRTRFSNEMNAALTVFSAFPIVFAGDPEEGLFTAIGRGLRDALMAEKPDFAAARAAAMALYRPLAERLRAQSRA
ncbi:hypothetical protein [Magnetospirillum sp. UT-4]|uniref:hypothetical protein n=1 Tax=Magnetospirillum sp. UT-4 TaxID=2681467 RepID=UPI00137E82FF|nr:hypothetical protein [Magnetospirillum sp. UT-4]CAA7621999.1 conserved hypothetical protein [Magnetospirillum sp. UT-4]